MFLQCTRCGKNKQRGKSPICLPCKRREYILKIRRELCEAYGGSMCISCGYSEIEELTLDHVFNDGAEEAKRLLGALAWTQRGRPGGISGPVIQYLKRNNYPNKERYQILCPTCQMRKRNGKPFIKPLLDKNLSS